MGTACCSNCILPKTNLFCQKHSLSLNQEIDLSYPKQLVTKIKLSEYTALQEYLNDTDQNSSDIEYLTLSFKHAELNEKEMANLFRELRQFQELKFFKINLCMKKISQKCIKILMKSLKTLYLLEFMFLNFYGIAKIQVKTIFHFHKLIKEQGLPLICDCLKDSTKLTHLDLNFGWCEITDSGIEVLCDTLLKLPQLNYLSLNLREIIELKQLELFFKTIITLQYLQHFGLILLRRKFSEFDFVKLIGFIKKLKFLKSFHFEHDGFDISLKNSLHFFNLGEFKHLIKLKIILLELVYADINCVINIKNGLSNLINLEEMEVDIGFKQTNIKNESSGEDNSQSECSLQSSIISKLFKALSKNSKLVKCKICINGDDVCAIDTTKNNDTETETDK